MRFSLNKTILLKELNHLQGVVERKNTIPILSNILIQTIDQSLISLVATDLDVSLYTECAADVSQPGAIVLQARKLFDIVRNLPDSDINFIKEDNDWVKIICGASEFKIVGQAKEHFPSTPQSVQTGVEIPSTTLHNLISRTIFAITQEESRYALNGSLILLADGKLQMIATDGHRLALAASTLDQSSTINVGDQIRVIVPKKALSELLKLTAGPDDILQFFSDENHLYFQIAHRKLTSRMLAGQFPNYELVLPKNNDRIVPLNAEKIAQAIRRVALMADERSRGIKLELTKGRLNVTSQSTDVGEAREVIPVDYAEDDLTIGFNAQYLLDFFNVVGTEEVAFEFKDEQSPTLIRPVGDSQYDYKYVVMPMRLL